MDGATRDFATLQVVFGRGEEYFASDKHGKLEYKELDVKKQPEDEEKTDKPALRRTRTVSFLRPLSDISTRSDATLVEPTESRRSPTASSRRTPRPPSLSYSRTSSVASMLSELIDAPATSHPSRAPESSVVPQWETAGVAAHSQQEVSNPIRKVNSEFMVPEGYMLVPIANNTTGTLAVRGCGCNEPLPPQRAKYPYVDTSTQTEQVSAHSRKPLHIDTTTTTSLWSTGGYGAVSQAPLSPAYQTFPGENPVFMGRMMNYFSKPGYQLGDSLMSSYQLYEPPVYTYQDEFRQEALQFR